MILPVCTVVTENCYKEFLLFKHSIELFHDCEWYISCDEFVKNSIEESEKVHAHLLIENDDCDHVVNDEKQNENFTKLILTKFSICASIFGPGSIKVISFRPTRKLLVPGPVNTLPLEAVTL